MENIVKALFFFMLVFSSCSKIRKVKRSFFRMDTVVNVTLCAGREIDIEKVWVKVDSSLENWEQRFSQTHEKSEVGRLNRLLDKEHPVQVSDKLASMIKKGLDYGDTLGGSFDITILPIKGLWGFKEKESKHRVPSQVEIDSVLEMVDYSALKTEGDFISSKLDGIEVDVGGLAKGYSLILTASLLESEGINNYLISAGGDITAGGRRPDGGPWKIGVRHPRKNGALLAVLDLDSGSVVTSGDYERFWVENGKRYHHIFNPLTGKPCMNNRSLTIWSMDPVRADILSTGLFCMNSRDILSFVNKRDGLECICVDSTGSAVCSRGWEGRLVLKE